MIVKPIVKFKTGMKVRVKDTLHARSNHYRSPEFYPCPGITGVIKSLSLYEDRSEVAVLVQWERGSTSEHDEWYIDGTDIEVIT